MRTQDRIRIRRRNSREIHVKPRWRFWTCLRARYLSLLSFCLGPTSGSPPSSCSPTSLGYVDGVDSVYARLRVRMARVLCLANERAFCPSSPFSLTLLLPSLEFALPVSSALALSRTREKENERKRESSTHLCPPYRGFSALFSRHPLTHSSTRSLVPRSTRPRALPPPLSFNHPPDHPLLPLPPPRLFISPFLSVLLLSVFPSSSPWCVAQ